MKIDTPNVTDLDVVTDGDRRWAIYMCSHGCLHIEIDRLTLMLTTEEFHALQALMHRACDRFHRCGHPDGARVRAH